MTIAAISAPRVGSVRPNPSRPVASRRGFTLVEMVVVLAIIGILSSLLMPGIARTKSRAQAIQCLSHLRQWGFGLHVYSTDGEDRLPRDGTDEQGFYAVETGATNGPGSPSDPFAWFNSLPVGAGETPLSNYWSSATRPRDQLPFPGGVGPLWHCPAARSATQDRFLRDGAFGFFSIAMNQELKLLPTQRLNLPPGYYEYPQMPRLGSIPSPDATVLMTDIAFSPTLEPFSGAPERNGVLPAGSNREFAQRHRNRGANLVFIDGHAGFFSRKYITTGTASPLEKLTPGVVWNPNSGN